MSGRSYPVYQLYADRDNPICQLLLQGAAHKIIHVAMDVIQL